MDNSRSVARDVRHNWPHREVGELAARQRTNVTNPQLRALGIHRHAITRAVARGMLWRVHRGVYSLVALPARPPLAAEHAALLACGGRALLSHHTAALLHGLRVPGPDRVELTVVGGDRRHGGLVVHRTGRLRTDERVRITGLPVTSVALTVVDLSSSLGHRALEQLVDEALKKTTRAKLDAEMARRPGRAGAARLRALLDPERPSSLTWSVAEERLLTLIRRAGLPAPEVNVVLGRYIPDLLWRAQRVIVEFDSRAHHSGPRARHHDAGRHNDLTAQGFRVIHVTWRDLTERPEQVLVWIAVALFREAA